MTQELKKLSNEEKIALEVFFRKILLEDSFAYVLFGSKPIATAMFYQHIPEAEKDELNCAVKKGWTLWHKHKHRFILKNYILRSIGSEEDKGIKIVLVNKKRLLEEVENNLPVFQQRLGKDFTPSKLLELFEYDPNPFKDVLQSQHLLIGIIYGFGKHNSSVFEKEWKKMKKLQDLKKFSSQEELQKAMGKTETFQRCFEGGSTFIKLPKFNYDHKHKETRSLMERYQNECLYIDRVYKNNDFLQITLEKLTSD